MNTNYKIILDEERLKSFIDWLPELKPNETYFVALMARNKYGTGDFKITGGELQLRKFISKKQYLLSKIRQLEVPFGAFTDNGRGIPQENLVLTITPNPRNIRSATNKSITELNTLLLSSVREFNPYSIVLSQLQVTPSKKIFTNLDYDHVKAEDLIDNIQNEDIINLDAIHVLQTRGGVHLLVKLQDIDKKYSKTWYLKMTRLPGYDKKSGSTDGLMPVPGCTQGGFSPYLFPAVSPQLVEQKT